MQQQDDDPNHPSTLPQPELNPLLNPTLGRNMGRWAEVYFTSAPEKRDEAVQQLLRELENEIPQSEDVAPAQLRRPAPLATKASIPATTHDEMHEVTCFWCGYVNRPQYKFCGRCGEPLTTLDADPRVELEKFETSHDFNPTQDGMERPIHLAEQSATPHSFPPKRTEPDFGTLRNDVSIQDLFSTPPERSYRPWFAAVLAVVVLALAYVSWRGTSTKPASRPAAEVPQTAADSAAPPAAINPAPSQIAETASNPGAKSATSTPSVVDIPPVGTNSPSAAAPASTAPAATSPASASPVIDSASTTLATGKGFEELAQARDFLDGTNGKQRNTLQAAQWLWKAVRKENIDATMLLSGLYLRGDGVPKSCEQARLLLDAAALKGRKDAAGELQNLPAFGCK